MHTLDHVKIVFKLGCEFREPLQRATILHFEQIDDVCIQLPQNLDSRLKVQVHLGLVCPWATGTGAGGRS